MINNKVKTCRFFARKTQDQLFIETGIPQSIISRIENGYLKPKEAEKKALAKALGVKLDDLFPDNKRQK